MVAKQLWRGEGAKEKNDRWRGREWTKEARRGDEDAKRKTHAHSQENENWKQNKAPFSYKVFAADVSYVYGISFSISLYD